LVVPLLPVYAHELGAGVFQIGLIFGAFSLSRSISVPHFGRQFDMHGRKPFLTKGLLLFCLFSIRLLFSTSVHSLILMIMVGEILYCMANKKALLSKQGF
jgi:DHA1 family multidrug resistance protein-like MFS transporter